MRFGTWSVRSLCRAVSLKTIASKLAKYNLDLVAVQEVRWLEGSSQPPDDYTFFYGNGNDNHHLGTSFTVRKGITSAVKRVEFIGDRVSYITLRSHDIIVLNMHATTEDKSDDMMHSSHEELACVFDQFTKYHMKILLRDFNAEVGREDVFKPTIGNESLHEIIIDNGVRVINFITL